MVLTNNTLLQGGKYKIIRHIASGGFGNTYEGIHTLMGTRVAIKEFFVKDFCNRDESTSQVSVGTQSKAEFVNKLKKKFVEEATVLFKMSHPNIVRVTDVFEENSTAYYVMDYVDGETLQEIVKKQGALPESLALKYICQVAEALRYVHGQNRLHLDVKPGNIIVDKQDNAILIDFGASKHYDDESGENTSTLLGVLSKGYAPPEQSTGFTDFSPATDIYALGATLYKLITGVTPPSSIALMAGDSELAPIPDSISVSTKSVIAASMQKRTLRPQTIDDFLRYWDDNGNIYLGVNNKEKSKGTKKSTIKQSLEEENTIVEVKKEAKPKSRPQKSLSIPLRDVDICEHQSVDLGLSVDWATCNIGATSPEEYGDEFYWGYIDPVESEEREPPIKAIKKYNISGEINHDPATARWGEDWRIPTKSEFNELLQLNWEKGTYLDVQGYKISNNKGDAIFLPSDEELDGCYYWTANSIGKEKSPLYYDSDIEELTTSESEDAFCIRPVRKKTAKSLRNNHIEIASDTKPDNVLEQNDKGVLIWKIIRICIIIIFVIYIIYLLSVDNIDTNIDTDIIDTDIIDTPL